MAKLTVKGARLGGCAVVLGECLRNIEDEPEYWDHDKAQLGRLRAMIGLGTRYVAAETTTTADLCEAAARRLLPELGLGPSDVGAIISVTQTPDYRMPGNAHLLHGRLGLGVECPALDVGMGCSGFVYGFWLASMTAASTGLPVLLVAGDTLSKNANKKDRTTAPLFGDAGSAALILPEAGETRFILRADGSKLRDMYIPAGGARTPSTPSTAEEHAAEDGSVRSPNDLHMDGFAVFSFAMTEQPQLLRDIVAYAETSLERVDYVVLHQANRYIVETIARKAGIPAEKAPSDVFSRFGNQNAASIPGVLCGSLAERLRGGTFRTILQGYGTGLSWGACHTILDKVLCLAPVPYAEGGNMREISPEPGADDGKGAMS